ncbi:MAG: GPI anchored serine-threonine rich family protein [Candidatus Staskawiczbacteria bacterium]|jgi:hypothetical protein
MQKKKQKNHSFLIFIVIILVLLVIVAAAEFFVFNKNYLTLSHGLASLNQPSITINSPAAGATLQAGQTYNITWRSTAVSNVEIWLVKQSPVGDWVLSYSVPASAGTFSWTVGSFLSAGSDYKIKIFDPTNNLTAAYSSFFSIASAKPSITISSPSGNVQWPQGSTQTITYSTTGIDHVSINLAEASLGGGGHVIAANQPASGSYSWKIPTTYSPAPDYWIQIIGYTSSNIPVLPFKNSQSFSIVTAKNCGSLVWDAETGVCMEKPVSDFFNNYFRTIVKTCDNCTNLPQPVISINGGTLPATLNVYLDNKKLLNWYFLPLTDSHTIISNPSNAYEEFSGVTGTNTISYLIKTAGTYFQNRYEILTPNQTTSIKYNVVKRTGKYGSAYFFVLANSDIDMNGAMNTFDSIALKESTLAGLNTPDPYYVMVWPSMIGGTLGAEGDFYFGNHVMSVSYGGEQYYDQNPNVFAQEISHEYTHDLQATKHIPYSAGFMTEGMADAVAIFSGFKSWSDVGFGGQITPGCINDYNPSEIHSMGRCFFKHLDQDGYLTTTFMNRLFNPNPTDTFTGLSFCSDKFTEPDCVADLTKLLNFLTGKDMTTFVQKELQSN